MKDKIREVLACLAHNAADIDSECSWDEEIFEVALDKLVEQALAPILALMPRESPRGRIIQISQTADAGEWHLVCLYENGELWDLRLGMNKWEQIPEPPVKEGGE